MTTANARTRDHGPGRDRGWWDTERFTLTPALALLPLRGFLGVTFVYAGIQKLSDPGFLHAGAPTYIGTQLMAFAHGTPGGFLLRAFALPHPRLAGVSVALIEILVGLLVVSGLLTRAAATVGLLLNLLLFLTNSWNTSPYFLGSDIVFVFAWLPFVLAGPSGQPALDHVIDRLVALHRHRLARTQRARGAPGAGSPGYGAAAGRPGAGAAVTRRGLLTASLGAAGTLTLLIAGVSALAKGGYRNSSTLLGDGGTAGRPRRLHGRRTSAANRTGTAGHTTADHAQTAGHARSKAPSLPAGAVPIAAASQLARGRAAIYRDPSDGQPDIIIRQPDGSLSAFSAICTHAGCEVGYEGGQIACPCHGGVYNPRTGAVESGPPPTPLPARRVLQHAGKIYALRD